MELPRARGLALLAVLGCGRTGFESVTVTDTQAPGDDAGLEVCNGIDDTNNGLIDEGCPCVPFDVMIGNDSVRGGDGAVWTGAEVVLVASETGLHLDRVRDGMVLAPVVLGGAALVGANVAWTGSVVAVVWSDSVNLDVTTYAPGTGTVGPTTPIAAGPIAGRIAWAGDRLVTAWITGGMVFVRELDPTGAPLGPALAVSATTQSSLDAVIATPRSYALGMSTPPGSYGILFVDRQTHAPMPVTSDLGSGAYVRLRAEPAGIAAMLGGPIGVAKLQMFTEDGTPFGSGVSVPAGPNGAFQGVAAIGSSSSVQLVGFDAPTTHDVMSVSFDPATRTFGPVTVLGTFASGAYGTLPSSFGSEGRVGFVEYYQGATSGGTRVIQRCM